MKVKPENLPAKTQTSLVDPIADSLTNPLAVAFSKSSSPNYGAAVELAKLASKYAENTIGKSVLHTAVFSADRVQMSRALALLRFIKGIKSTQIYAGGKLLISSHKTEEVINCYLTAAACTDWRAHCHKIIDDAFMDERRHRSTMIDIDFMSTKKENRYLLPCRYLAGFGGTALVLDREYVAKPIDQVQALAVRNDCAWCPNFKPEDFRKL